jgi:ubiquinone/menaquinone biosynthesis C-methylase UbiE
MQNKLSKEELQDIIQWDVKNWGKAISFWQDYYPIKPGMKVLAIGERGGGLSLYFALKGCDVVCTDFRDFPDTTKALHERYGVSSKITYAWADMRTLDFPDETFDIVVFKSVIGALDSYDDSMKSLSDIQRVLKKGGAFLFAENSTASSLHKFFRKRFVKWQAKWRYVPDSEFEVWKNGYSAAFSDKKGFIALFGRTEWQRKFLGYLDVIFSAIVPRSWRYIYFGVFIKWGVSASSK